MNDTFSFHAPAAVFRRRIDPRWIRLGVALALVAAALGSFARWVVDSEHRSDAVRASAVEAASRPSPSPLVASPIAVFDDHAAMDAAGAALTAARDAYARTGSFTDASTAAMAEAEPRLIFVDGPSTASSIVSVEAGVDTWAAAVMGDAGACFWVAVTSSATTRYGTGSDCTGAAAMAAADPSW